MPKRAHKDAAELRPAAPDRAVALDPGERIFSTFFSPNGVWGELGADVAKRDGNLSATVQPNETAEVADTER